MTGQNFKKYQQKDLSCIIDEKTRNCIFSLPHDKSRENWTRKNELIIDFEGQNESKNNKILILGWHLRKHWKITAKRHI